MESVASPEVFLHIKVVMGMVISLSLARLLTGIAGIIQHPGKAKPYAVHSRRRWFFGTLALTYAVDIVDTAIKGADHIHSIGWEYPARNIVYVILCLIAAWTANRRFHTAFVWLNLVYQVSFIFRIYDILG